MPKFPITKAFQKNELPIGWIEFTDKDLEWLTAALFEQTVKFATAFKRDPTSGIITLMEISIVPTEAFLAQLEMEKICLK